MTSNKEEYLKIIYHKGGENNYITNKVIASALNVAPSSVTEMLPKLQKEGLVKLKPYKGTKLTEKGLHICLTLIRSCSLWEVFLVKHLNYNWKEAIEESHHLEHIANERLLNKLDEFLEYPIVCPHGSVIPRPGGTPFISEFIRLDQLEANKKAFIKQVLEEVELLSYLERLGIHLNMEIEVLETSDYEGPVKIRTSSGIIFLSLKAANGIYVDRI